MKYTSLAVKYLLLVLLCLQGFLSCQKNDVVIDSSTNRMFRPVTFTVSGITSSSAQISWAAVPGVYKYVFETSTDSLKFEKIIVRDTISETMFDLSGLNSGTAYSVRVHCLSKDPSVMPSLYQAKYFKTNI